MKIVGFTSWQHCTAQFPAGQDSSKLAFQIIPPPSVNNTHVKRRSKSQRHTSKREETQTLDKQPDFALTSSHQISVLGHNPWNQKVSSKDEDTLKNVPQWVYNTRPGPMSSLLHDDASHDGSQQIGAMVDQGSRTVYALQEKNCVLKMWSLDVNVSGPDDNVGDETTIKKVRFDSAVSCIHLLPLHRVAGRRMSVTGREEMDVDVIGGVAGMLVNGQMFIVLSLSCSDKPNVRIFGEPTKKTPGTRSGKKKNRGKTQRQKQFFSFPNLMKPKTISSEKSGQKRKHASNTDWAEVNFTTVSYDSEKNESISLCRHSVTISSCDDGGTNDATASIQGTYCSHNTGTTIPQKMSNGSGKDIKVTLLDNINVSIVYPGPNGEWHSGIMNTMTGEMTSPFNIQLGGANVSKKSSGTSVVQIGGLSSSLLAVLTSDDILTVYDIRRAAVLHDLDVNKTLSGYGIPKGRLSITADLAGTIGIISRSPEVGDISVCYARVGMFDSNDALPSSIGSKSLLKGSYNLARSIASSISTVSNSNSSRVAFDPQPSEKNINAWFHFDETKSLENGKEPNLDTVTAKTIESMKAFLVGKQTNGNTRKSLSEIFRESCSTIKTMKQSEDIIHQQKKPRLNGKHSTENIGIPQRLIDTTFSISIQLLLNPNESQERKKDAFDVLANCIQSEKISGRVHFSKVNSQFLRDTDDTFCAVLASLGRTKTDQMKSQLLLIQNMLKFCCDSIPEHMLVTMLHFIVCHTNQQGLSSHWAGISKDSWYHDSEISLLEKRLESAKNKCSQKGSDNDNHKILVNNLENRLFLARQVFFACKIVTYSACNSALLRSALTNGLTQVKNGEVEVLIKMMAKLLKKVGRDSGTSLPKGSSSPNRTSCIVQWLSALTDAYMGVLLKASTESSSEAMERVKKGVSTVIAQGQGLLQMKDLLEDIDSTIARGKKSLSKKAPTERSSMPTPLYSIESLIF